MRYFFSIGLCFWTVLWSLPVYAQAPKSGVGVQKAAVGKDPKSKKPAVKSNGKAKTGTEVAAGTSSTPKSKSDRLDTEPALKPSPSPATVQPDKTETITNTVLKPIDKDGRVPVRARAPSIQGPTGLDRLWSADTGPEGTIRMRLGLSWFDADDFPADGSSNLYLGTHLAAAYTPHEWVETFLGLRATSNTNNGEQPSLIQTQGDLTLGVKAAYPVTDTIRLGAAVATRFLSGMGSGGLLGGATSVDLRFLSTFDLTRSQNIPLRIHFELGNYFENSEVITDDLAGEPSVIQEFGLQIARYDRLNMGIGMESPFNEYVNPFLEYQISKPHYVEISRTGEGSNDYTFASVPHSLTVGVRSFPVEHLAIDVGVRIGLSDSPMTGVPATPPYMVLFGVAYTLDPRPKLMTKVVEKTVKVPQPKAVVADGKLKGRVLGAKTKKPIKGARISYTGVSGLSAQLTGADGRFGGYRFKAGPVQFNVQAPGYKPGSGKAMVVVGKTADTVVSLKIDPAQQSGTVEIRVFGTRGKPIAANIAFAGKASGVAGVATVKSAFSETLPAGRHTLTVTAKGYPPLRVTLLVKGGQKNTMRYTMQKRGAKRAMTPRRGVAKRRRQTTNAPRRTVQTGPQRSRGRLATVSTQSIVLKESVTFQPGSAKLTEQGRQALRDVAKGLKRVKRIKQVRISAHVTGQGSRDRDSRLSIARARAVKAYLVRNGVAAKRLQARGYGGLTPVAPSITSRGRARNERIDFVILRK
jgi:outer membrane protein OmpA-like peptidoglycan-associated protein